MGLFTLFQNLLGKDEKPKAQAPTKAQAIAVFEKELGQELPPLFRQFILEPSPQRLTGNCADVVSEQDGRVLYTFVISRYIGMNALNVDELANTWRKFSQEFPKQYLPIATDRFRNLMVICLQTQRVLFADLHNTVQEEDAAQEVVKVVDINMFNDTVIVPVVRFYWVSDSFKSFLEGLYTVSPFT
jgi:hypothetical protein